MDASSPLSASPAAGSGRHNSEDATVAPPPNGTSPTKGLTAGVESPRGVRFISNANDAGRGSRGRQSNAISPSGSFVGTDHERGGMLSGVASPLLHQEELPPFRLSREDVAAAFEFLDVNGSGVLTMSNLKQRLSAFYPQLTSKEYKFLIEDPSGNTTAVGAAQGGQPEQPATASSYAPPSAADTAAKAGKGGQRGHGGAKQTAAGSADVPLQQDGMLVGSPSRVYGSRAGLDVDQLWDLIQSFQQMQQNLGAGTSGFGGDAAHRASTSTVTRRTAGGASMSQGYEASVASSLMHGGGGGSSVADGGFDAVAEAFRIYDPRNTHYVDREVLSRIMAQIGFGELSEEDLTLLIGTADFDGDGRISLDDFRRLVSIKRRSRKE